jgi:hypothetical protein
MTLKDGVCSGLEVCGPEDGEGRAVRGLRRRK